jgi:phosphatidylserine/phosphatidylglycerophosphate/cardiolipin synthase-like enzyme
MTRHDLDLYLSDIESEFWRDIDHLVRGEVAEALAEAEADREYEAEMRAAAKEARRAKPQVGAETGGTP